MVGLLLGDGCLSQQQGKQERITLALKDRDFMERLRQVVCPGRKPYVSKARRATHSDSYSIVTTNPTVIAVMKSMGMTRRKFTTLSFPTLPEEWHRLFVRGYFDANGSVFQNEVNGHSYVHVSITTGSRDFAEGLATILKSHGCSAHIVKDARHTAYYVKLYRQEEIRAFRDWLYQDAQWFLPRKRIAFMMI